MEIDYCAKLKAGLFLPAFTLMLELSGKTLAMCLFPATIGMNIFPKIQKILSWGNYEFETIVLFRIRIFWKHICTGSLSSTLFSCNMVFCITRALFNAQHSH